MADFNPDQLYEFRYRADAVDIFLEAMGRYKAYLTKYVEAGNGDVLASRLREANLLIDWLTKHRKGAVSDLDFIIRQLDAKSLQIFRSVLPPLKAYYAERAAASKRESSPKEVIDKWEAKTQRVGEILAHVNEDDIPLLELMPASSSRTQGNITIFYSWQSDIIGSRNYLEQCLKHALSGIPGAVIDTATRDTEGAVDISASILAKIDAADFILADISVINHRAKGRKTPNPNVLYELGYAVGSRGERSIIMVADARTTDITQLPFDIRNRRMIVRDFTKSNQAAIAGLINNIVSGTPPISKLDHPYIFISGGAFSSIGGASTLQIQNDESQSYFLEEFAMGKVKQSFRVNIDAGKLTKVVTPTLINPFDHIEPTATLIVSRLGSRFRITITPVFEASKDGKYNLVDFEARPTVIEALGK